MKALTTSIVAFVVIMGGAMLGGRLREMLPKHHLSEETKDIVKVGIAMLTTLAALVLGLLIASAKSSFDVKEDEVRQSAAKIILLDRNLRQLGPEAQPIRETLHETLVAKAKRVSVDAESALRPTSGRATGIETIQEALLDLAPATDAQKRVRDRALQLAGELAQMRWLVLEQAGSSIQMPFLVILVSWLAIIAGALGVFAPRNGTVLAVTVLCSFAVSCAIYLILEMDQPFSGLLSISDAPLREAISFLER